MQRRGLVVVAMCCVSVHASAAPPVALGVLVIDEAPAQGTGVFLLRGRLDAPWPAPDALPAEARPLAERVRRADTARDAAAGEASRRHVHRLGPTLQALIADATAARAALLRALGHGAGAFGAEAWLVRGRLERDAAVEAHFDVEDAALAAGTDPPPLDLSAARASFARAAALGGTREPGLWARLVDAEAALDEGRFAVGAGAGARLDAEAAAALAIVSANAAASPLRAQALLDLADLHEGTPDAAAYLARARDGASDAQLRYLDVVALRDERARAPERALASGVALLRRDGDDDALVHAIAELLVSLDDPGGVRLPADVPAERATGVLVAAAELALANGDVDWASRAATAASVRAGEGPAAPAAAAILSRVRAAPIRVEGAAAWLTRIGRLCALHTELVGETELAPIDVLVRLTRVRQRFRVLARPAEPRRAGARVLAACVGAPGHDDAAIAERDVVTATLRFTEGARE